MAGLFNSPLFSTIGVLAAGGVFAFAIYSFYPDSDKAAEAVPIIKAEAVPIKIEPADAGGMDIPFQDSTIFDADRMAASGTGKIENLLEPVSNEEDQVMDKEILLAEQGESAASSEIANITESPAFNRKNAEEQSAGNVKQSDTAEKVAAEVVKEEKVTTTPAKADESQAEQVEQAKQADKKPAAVAAAQTTTSPAPKAKPVKNILAAEPEAEVEKAPAQKLANEKAPAQKKAAQGTPALNEAGQSPETLAFVRSVLEKKDNEKVLNSAATTGQGVVIEKSAGSPETIEPASGVEGRYSGAKTHYVQLASISDRSRADAEWVKLKSAMSAIPGNADYRVEEANLAQGTFFRIQAGPFAEAQAKDICDAIKVQKPGGCLVVR